MASIVAIGIIKAMATQRPLPELAHTAAALIAEEGLDYASAKRKAYERLTGGHGGRIAREMLPTNEEVEEALREYQELFQSDEQPARLLSLRKKSLALMELLEDFAPVVTGAIANGTASEFSDIHLQCFADSAKELGIFLADQRIANEVGTLAHFRSGEPDVEAIALQWQGELAVIAVYPEHEARISAKASKGRLLRINRQELLGLIEQTEKVPPKASETTKE
jgi:hypothetical protein